MAPILHTENRGRKCNSKQKRNNDRCLCECTIIKKIEENVAYGNKTLLQILANTLSNVADSV